MKITTSLVALAAAGITLTACALPDASSKDALPQALPSSPTKAPGAEPIVPKVDEEAVPDETPTASTCDIAREAFLTGTASDIKRALKALKVDRTADATAREYASYYLGRDKRDPGMQQLDQGLIVTSCSL